MTAPTTVGKTTAEFARQAIENGDYESAKAHFDSVPGGSAAYCTALIRAGELASANRASNTAFQHFLTAYEIAPTADVGQLGLFSAAEVRLAQCRLSEAERLFRKVLEHQPANPLTNERIASLLSLTGRRWETLDHYFVLVQGGAATIRELAILADVGRYSEDPEFVETCLERAPDDMLVRAGFATQAFRDGYADARSLLEELLADEPGLIASQAMLGELLVTTGTDVEFGEWRRSLPKTADESTDIWLVYGLWVRKHSHLELAAACLSQAASLNPFNRRAYRLLGQVLTSLKSPNASEVVSYANKLAALSQTADEVLRSDGNDQRALRKAAMLLESLGRTWEACAWGAAVRKRFPQQSWPSELFQKHAARLAVDLPRVERDHLPELPSASGAKSGMASLMKQIDTSPRSSSPEFSLNAETTPIRFATSDVIDFTYLNSEDMTTKGVRTFEQTGGGVAILDYDRDGCPDVFLSQGTRWQTAQSRPDASPSWKDGLFRNRSGTSFQDVSIELPTDISYGQGCSIGDFNNDGFADIYVANVGRNSLYLNLGDGTFEDSSDEIGLSEEAWTASVMVADLNDDGLPDLFDVNYLEGEDIYTKICKEKACSPKAFDGAQDAYLANLGDGTFRKISNATPSESSKGLGLVAFESGDERRRTVFVANDQVANHMLTSSSPDVLDENGFQEEAIFAGLAFNDDGVPMACMGVALDDFDQNGLLDIFVTNFHEEPNTLYLQDSPGLYIDGTRGSGLYEASIFKTGWGTQSIDADLNGWPDLVITNGHVDDYRDSGGPYKMEPLFFRNNGGRFDEIPAAEVGDWFAGKYLGRGLARVDWNLDGRDEFIVSNINTPASILVNMTQNPGHGIRLRMNATTTARDAIGVRVAIETGERRWQKQLTAGDGYMASNQRILSFGLGAVDRIDRVVIRWPGGATSHIERPEVDQTYDVVEGGRSATVWQAGEPTADPTTWVVKTIPVDDTIEEVDR